MDNLLDRLESKLAAYRAKVADLEGAVRVIRQELGSESVLSERTESVEPSAREGTNGTIPSHSTARPTEPGPRPGHDGGDLFGLKIAEAAKRILAECPGEWISYRDLARTATERGYQGRERDQSEKSIADSFYHTMKRKSDIFESRGPNFRLRDESSGE